MYEYHLTKLIKFIDDSLSLFVLNRLQILQDVAHELSVYLVVPGVERVATYLHEAQIFVLLDSEELPKAVQKITENELNEKLIDSVVWKLIQNFELIFVVYSWISIILPSVVKVFFNFFLQIMMNVFSIVEFFHAAHELRQALSIFKIRINNLKFLKNSQKDTHNDWKYGYSKQQHKRAKDHFIVINRVIIAKSYSRKSGKWVINGDQQLSLLRLLKYFIIDYKVTTLMFQSRVTKHVEILAVVHPADAAKIWNIE